MKFSAAENVVREISTTTRLVLATWISAFSNGLYVRLSPPPLLRTSTTTARSFLLFTAFSTRCAVGSVFPCTSL
jgi:hypothetical protein